LFTLFTPLDSTPSQATRALSEVRLHYVESAAQGKGGAMNPETDRVIRLGLFQFGDLFNFTLGPQLIDCWLHTLDGYGYSAGQFANAFDMVAGTFTPQPYCRFPVPADVLDYLMDYRPEQDPQKSSRVKSFRELFNQVFYPETDNAAAPAAIPPSLGLASAPDLPYSAINAQKEAAFVLPDWIPEKAWNDYLEMRRSIKKPVTRSAKGLLIGILKKLAHAGENPKLVLEQSTMNGWQGLFPLSKASKRAQLTHCPHCGKELTP
jgi:hypothetical protein